MELFEQIRRDRDREGLSTRALAVKHGVHRRAVRQALASPVPPVKRSPVWRPAPKMGAYHALIDGWLEADRDAPRKQRHTATRVHARLLDEQGAAGVSYATVRDYVARRRPERKRVPKSSAGARSRVLARVTRADSSVGRAADF